VIYIEIVCMDFTISERLRVKIQLVNDLLVCVFFPPHFRDKD
jgi:hypothetical protein